MGADGALDGTSAAAIDEVGTLPAAGLAVASRRGRGGAAVPPTESGDRRAFDRRGGEASRLLRVCGGGDLVLGTNLDTTWTERASKWLGYRVDPYPAPDSLLRPLRPLIADADVVVLNIEGAIGDGRVERSKCRPGADRCYAFRQPVAVARALTRLLAPAPLVANLANNHALDAGTAGLEETVRRLRAAGAHITGLDTLPTRVEVGPGDTIAFLGYSSARAGPDARDLDAVRRHVARAAARHRRVVVTMHMGAEGAEAAHIPGGTEYFLGEDRGDPVAFGRTAVEAGASFVVGHGPHVLRAVEWWRDGLIFYSLGNLLTYGPFNLLPPRDLGGLGCAELDANGRVRWAELRPTRQRFPGLIRVDTTEAAILLADSLGRADLPWTAARLRADGSILRRR